MTYDKRFLLGLQFFGFVGIGASNVGLQILCFSWVGLKLLQYEVFTSYIIVRLYFTMLSF